ncbi:putative N6-adenine methyltransferase-domain-containing protein [Zalerion maritima]|uniref:Protein-lysine N-methyltransferase EFM5 n=1 Tax=Zalerion maritima TaxID=339359 RepID=A0AAD5WR41_9PEZI|nr:putative N6-adenine methyltransferase-domain-containing protein [Zalerion maritima]
MNGVMDISELTEGSTNQNRALSSAAMAALQEFYAERDERAEKFDRLKAEAEEKEKAMRAEGKGKVWSMDAFTEDWNISQFWVSLRSSLTRHLALGFLGPGDGVGWSVARLGHCEDGKGDEEIGENEEENDEGLNHASRSKGAKGKEAVFRRYSTETAQTYARQLLAGTTSSSTIVVVSTPSTFVQLKNLVSSPPSDLHIPSPPPRLILLEHDARFEVFGKDFVWYDFNSPLKLPSDLKGAADRVILDPPFLSEECQTKSAMTVRWLVRKDPSSPPSRIDGKPANGNGGQNGCADENANRNGNANGEKSGGNKVIVCTGERMESLVMEKLYKPLGVRTTSYEVVHARGLSNEFKCYSNFECDDWQWVDS